MKIPARLSDILLIPPDISSLDITVAALMPKYFAQQNGTHDDSKPFEPTAIAAVSPHTPYVYITAERDDVGTLLGKAQHYQRTLDGYLRSPLGKAFLSYVQDKTGEAIDSDRVYAWVGVLKDPKPTEQGRVIMAGVSPENATIFFSDKHAEYAQRYARSIKLPWQLHITYTITHELAHLLLGIHDEKALEETLMDFFISQADKSSGSTRAMYLHLARIAADRYHDVEKHYRRGRDDNDRDNNEDKGESDECTGGLEALEAEVGAELRAALGNDSEGCKERAEAEESGAERADGE